MKRPLFMKPITLTTGEYLMVDVPEDAEPYLLEACNRAGMEQMYALTYMLHGVAGRLTDLPPGHWKIIGRGSKLTDEQWWQIVDHDNGYGKFPHKDYMKENSWFTDNTESGLSLLESLGLKASVIILKKI